MTAALPKRLIEVDLPIKRISAHSRREKSIRFGHISTLHIWWARRPLAACRAVMCAALWPDPADPLCPETFRDVARQEMRKWVSLHLKSLSSDSLERFVSFQREPSKLQNNEELRYALLDFIADFSNWDNSATSEFLNTSRVLTQAAHAALGGSPDSKPLVVDPFAGGGAIPLEALRVGADSYASDLNPVAVLLNKVVLEYIPKYGKRLADEIRKHGDWIRKEAGARLASFYPSGAVKATPIAYLWARTIRCEGPGCGAEVPLVRSQWLCKKPNRSVALQLIPDVESKRVNFRIVTREGNLWVNADTRSAVENLSLDGTMRRGSATCPCCGYTTPVKSVRDQLRSRTGGAADARLMCVVEASEQEQGRLYRLPTELDFNAVREATAEIDRWRREHKTGLSLVPDEEISLNEIRRINVPIYGMTHWGDLFTSRQLLALSTLSQLVREVGTRLEQNAGDSQFVVAVQTCLALAVSRQVDYTTSLCSWHTTGEKINHTFGRQAIPMFWDFTEVFPLSGKTGDFGGAIEWVALVCETQGQACLSPGQASAATATKSPLPEASANAFITDPPYYDAVPYAYLSDFFYVWLRRMLFDVQADLFRAEAVPKEDEIVVDRPHELSQSTKDIKVYEKALTEAFAEGRRVLRPDGIGTIVFASKTTASWEAILKAVVDAGWIITASWPIDTEMEAKVAAIGQARLMSSVHLVCRPRQVLSSSTSRDVGDWRDVLHALPPRMRDWMPRLAKEGVVGADAIFACIGPALEIFSRHSHVEKANGQIVGLPEYLEQVWAAVAKEALSVVFKGADASGFEEDARLTAMWLWTLFAGQNSNGDSPVEQEQDEEPQEAGDAKKGYVLEYDTARKIAQGLGAHLESLTSLVQIKGETATLLSVVERTRVLFAKDESDAPTTVRKKKTAQLKLGFIAELEEAEGAGSWGSKGAPAQGATVLDRVHQCMILFAAGRSEALRRFLVEEGVGKDERFWRLAQVLLYLYPSASDERRWIEGVLARKKGLGF